MISKAVGLLQTENKTRFRYKLSSLIFVLMVSSTALQAETYLCQLHHEGLKKYYNVSFLEIDITRGLGRYGTNEKWFASYKTKSQKARIGMIHSWKQDLVPTNGRYKGQKRNFINKLGMKNDGSYDIVIS
ncbi:hypothetical protein N9744_01485 [bacterium]|nr:hypothetical protein [bacterium]